MTKKSTKKATPPSSANAELPTFENYEPLELNSFLSEDEDITAEEFAALGNNENNFDEIRLEKEFVSKHFNKKESFESLIDEKKTESQLAFERFQKEEFLIENSYSKEKRKFHEARRNLALAIYSRIIAEANLLAFHEESKKVSSFLKPSANVRELINDLDVTTEKVQVLKEKLGMGLSKITEASFLFIDEHHLENNKKEKLTVEGQDLLAQFEELLNFVESIKI